jgi:predicted CopG family antitoxin
VPKKGYKALTIRDDVYERFMKEVREAKKSNPEMDNSKFLKLIMDKHRSK